MPHGVNIERHVGAARMRVAKFGIGRFQYIWDSLCADNLEEMTKLKRRFGRRTDWQGCWGEYQCRRDKKRWDSQLASWRS